MNSLSHEIIDLDRPDTWPSDLVAVLSEHHDTLLTHEVGPLSNRYDAAIYSVVDALQAYSIVGWHCTRLADHEVEDIKNNGLKVLDIGLVSDRIGAAVRTGLLSASHGDRLTRTNQAAEKYRAGMLWFCFFRPGLAGESGIGDLLRFWGGEAVYNSHDCDPEIGPMIAALGKPAIVEAEIPIAWCGGDRGLRLAMNIGQRFVVTKGASSPRSSHVEDNIKRPLPSKFIRQVHIHPTSEFIKLAGCADWDRPL